MSAVLGDFVSKKVNESIAKTKKKKATIIKELGITTQYLNDIENGKRIPSPNLMKKMIKILGLNEFESIKLYDLASESHKTKKIPADIEEYITSNENIKSKIREIMKNQNKEYGNE